MTAPPPGGVPDISTPSVQPSPVPTGWEFFLLPVADGKSVVLTRISTPAGVTCVFGSPEEMLDIGQKMVGIAQQGITGIHLPPPRELIVPPGVNGHDNRG